MKELSFPNAELIVVCNNCSDGTYQKAKQVAGKNVRVLNFPYYTGKGGAVARGFRVAKGDMVGFVDADGAFYPSDVKKAIALTKKYDCVIASKWKGRRFSSVKQPAMRRFYSRVWNGMIKILFGLEFSDTQAGLKFFRRSVLKKIGNFKTSGFEFDVELLWKIRKAGLSVYEMPVAIRGVEKSTVSVLTVIPMALNLLRLRFF